MCMSNVHAYRCATRTRTQFPCAARGLEILPGLCNDNEMANEFTPEPGAALAQGIGRSGAAAALWHRGSEVVDSIFLAWWFPCFYGSDKPLCRHQANLHAAVHRSQAVEQGRR